MCIGFVMYTLRSLFVTQTVLHLVVEICSQCDAQQSGSKYMNPLACANVGWESGQRRAEASHASFWCLQHMH
jgi:hypothetical protein